MLSFFQENFPDLYMSFEKTFVRENRWLDLLKGLGITLEITLFATILGIILGVIVAIVRSTHDNNLSGKKCRTLWDYILKGLNWICNVYITVIRGTPVVIQLMIIYYVILASMDDGTIAAIIAFGINSGAYVAEIVRSGIMSIDKGQFEAGRSLGLNYPQTMISIILPQAFKNILPALGNEFIVLLKETSVSGYVTVHDITYAGNIIRSRTYEALFPLLTVAIIYLVIVLVLSYGLNCFERRLRKSDH